MKQETYAMARPLAERDWAKVNSSKALQAKREERKVSSGAYTALLILLFLYFGRPEDVIKVLYYIPMAKIAGGIAFAAMLLTWTQGKAKLAPETKLLWFILGWFLLGLPFAFWRAGDLNVLLSKLSKGMIVATLVPALALQWQQLKRLVWLQAALVAALTVLSLIVHHTNLGRLQGFGEGVIANPNDFANNIALNWPLCVAFLMFSRGAAKKLLWGLGILAMLVAVPLTYSRSGFLALGLAGVLVLWEFAIKRQKLEWVLISALLGMLLLVVSPGHYLTRLQSIVTGNEEYSMDRGSREARIQLLKESVDMAVHNPLFGIGAGNFEVTAGHWHVAHNTYTEIAAEGGFPILIMFLLVIRISFQNLRRVRKSAAYASDPEVKALTGCLWVSLAAYTVCAFFSSSEYNLYTYFLFGYIAALHQLTRAKDNMREVPVKTRIREFGKSYEKKVGQPAWIG